MSTTGSIYVAINTKDGAMYIGKTQQSFDVRRKQHYDRSKRSKTHFHNAIRKYGWDSFSWLVIDESNDPVVLSELEQEYIAYYRMVGKKLYNLTDGGEGILGLKFTNSPEGKLNKSKAQMGNKKWLGKHHTDESKKKISDGLKGRLAKTYVMKSPDGILTTIVNMSQFCKDNNLDVRAMSRVLSKENKQHKGWRIP